MLSSALVFSLAFCALLLVQVALRFWLSARQVRHVARHRNSVPAPFTDQVPLTAHQKAADYTIAKSRLGLIDVALGAVVVLAWTLLGGLNLLNQTLLAWLGAGMWQQLALLSAFVLVGALIELPLSWYGTFRLEQRFGFNKTTPALWLSDLAKSTLVGAAVGLPIAALMLWLMATAGPLWWLWAWGVWMGFNLLMLVLYPTVIAPLFNQFKPLEDETLKTRVSALMQRCGFAAKGLFVMDGSRRSAHANAYFTGFGAAKRVVFFDTLLQQLSPPEVDAVLAHELGHYKHRHILKRIASLFAMSLLGFAALGWLSQQAWFYFGLGVMPSMTNPNDAMALLLFMMVVPLLSYFLSPLAAQLSRKHEFEADAYAVTQTSGADLGSALLKLYKDNASTLTPDPLFARFYYSHPPASERLARLGATTRPAIP